MDTGQLEPIARRHGIDLIVQFGSTVTGRTHPRSDCDLGVLFRHTPDSLGLLAEVVADLKVVSPGRDIDVGVLNDADPLFLKQVMEHGRLLYGSERCFQALQLLAFKRYQDHRRYLSLERPYVERQIAAFRS